MIASIAARRSTTTLDDSSPLRSTSNLRISDGRCRNCSRTGRAKKGDLAGENDPVPCPPDDILVVNALLLAGEACADRQSRYANEIASCHSDASHRPAVRHRETHRTVRASFFVPPPRHLAGLALRRP